MGIGLLEEMSLIELKMKHEEVKKTAQTQSSSWII
jgi:hypothetical protein